MRDLKAALRRVFGDTHRLVIDAVGNAQDNRTWFVTHGQRRCVAKLPERRGGLTVAPELEHRLLELAADAGLAPRPLAHDPESGILFIEWIGHASALSIEQLRTGAWISRLGEALRTLHCLPAPAELRRFDPLAFATAYCADVRGSEAQVAQALLRECAEITEQFGACIAGDSVCHNDLHAGNLIHGEQLWLIDFEYAARAAPIVDVASYAAGNELDADASAALAAACLGEASQLPAGALRAVIRLQQILGALWEMARSDNNARS